MFSDYTEFEIEIQPRSGDLYPISARSPAGEQTAQLRSPGDDPAFQQLSARLGLFDTNEAILAEIGTRLFDALFQGPIGTLYTASRVNLKEDQGIVIQLRILPGAAEIAALPWEFLYDPANGPLAMKDAPVARYLPQPTPLPTFQATLPLKVLVTGAQTPPVTDIARELEGVQAALGQLGENVTIHVDPHLTVEAFRQYLREGYHVWHFVGHGGFDKTGATAQLLFEDSTGDADPVSAMELNIMLNRSGLRLVVLNACDTGKLVLEPFRSIAPALINAQVPAVVAQQFQIPGETTRAFVSDFYRSLAAGMPIDACVTEGRKAIMLSSSLGQPEWGIPVLYTRMAHGRLFNLPQATPVPPTAPPAHAPTHAPTPIVEHAALIEPINVQLQRKRRELVLNKLRSGIYERPQAHLIRADEQLRAEIRSLTDQLKTLEM